MNRLFPSKTSPPLRLTLGRSMRYLEQGYCPRDLAPALMSFANRKNPLRIGRAPGRRRDRKLERALVLLLLTGVASLASLTSGAPASAAGSGGRTGAHAARASDRLQRQAEEALQAKDYDGAARAFTELYKQTRQPDTLYRLGMIAEAQGRLLAAQDLLRRFLSDPRFDPAASVAEESEARRVLALPRPPSGKVNIIGGSGTLVYLDQRLVGSLPLARPLLVAPGKHTLVLEDGARRQQEDLDAAVGRFIELTYERSTGALLSTELPGVLLLESYPGLPETVARQLGQAVDDLVQRERLSPFPLALAMERAGTAPDSGCSQVTSCQCKLAQKNELEYVLNIGVSQRATGQPWQLKLDVVDADIGESAARSEQECAACDLAKATAALRTALPALLAEARRRPRAELMVVSTPPGAEVRAGGRLLGTTPLSRFVWAGALEVELTLPGHEPQRLPTVVSQDKPTSLTVTLVPQVAEPAPPPLIVLPVPPRESGRPRWRLALGGCALGVGAVLTGLGGSALAVADSCLPGSPPEAEACRQRFDTSGVGGGLLAAGLAVGVAGVLLLAIPERRRAPPPTLAAVAAGRRRP